MNRRSFSKAVAGLFAAMGLGSATKASSPAARRQTMILPNRFKDGAKLLYLGYDLECVDATRINDREMLLVTHRYMESDGSIVTRKQVAYCVNVAELDRKIGTYS
jgi:hypothetical protein